MQDSCKIFGTSATSNPPSQSQLQLKFHKNSWTDKSKELSCYWGCGKAMLCDGMRRYLCEKYGDKGTHKNERPQEQEVKGQNKS